MVDKAVAIVLPVRAFVAAGFEHSIDSMFLFPLAMLVQWNDPSVGASVVTWAGMVGHLLGGSVLAGSLTACSTADSARHEIGAAGPLRNGRHPLLLLRTTPKSASKHPQKNHFLQGIRSIIRWRASENLA